MSQPPPSGPQHHQQPHPGQPYAAYPSPQPPKKRLSTGAKIGIFLGGGFALLLLVGVLGAALGAGGGADSKPSSQAAAASGTPDAKPDPKAPAEKPDEAPVEKPAENAPAKNPSGSQADQFKEFVAKSGTATEKTAVTHVTRVQGADKQNDLMDIAEIHTDYTGGLLGPHGGDGKLLASAFAEWKSSKNGLVSVFDAKGELLANGNY